MKNILLVSNDVNNVNRLEDALSKHLDEMVKGMKVEFSDMVIDEEEEYGYKITKAIGIGGARALCTMHGGFDIIVSTVGTPDDFDGTPFCYHKDGEKRFGGVDFLIEFLRKHESPVS